MNREILARVAQRAADSIATALPQGARVVVIVTDESGDFVGVGSNTNNEDVERILFCASHGEDRIDHRGGR